MRWRCMERGALWLVTAIISLALAVGFAHSAHAETRVALVIGNGKYGHQAALPNVPNDAAAMAALFKRANFDTVDVRYNLGAGELRRALREFAGRAVDADVAVLFYAGHGIELGQTNYLIPVDARLTTAFDVEDEAVPLDRVLQAMEPAKRLRLILLDACRENPFVRSMKRTVAARSVGRGLGRVEPSTTNTLIAYATKPNAIAEDGTGANSPFTTALVKHLMTPGLDLRIALGHVRDEVLANTGNKQEPYVTGSLGGGIVSIAAFPASETKPGLVPMPLSAADRMWAVVKDTTSIAALEEFRRQHGATNLVYDRLAVARIEELKKQQVALLKAEEDRRRAEADLLRPGRGFRDCFDVCPEMVVVPAGSFVMGSPPTEERRRNSEGPQHKVTIARPFAVGRFPVTFDEWEKCVSAGQCRERAYDGGWGRGKRPVIDVSWDDARSYVNWLSRITGKIYRLLSEAEREYVTRAGTTTPFWWGSSITTKQANFNGIVTHDFEVLTGKSDGGNAYGEYRGRTVPVDNFAPNPWGLYQVHGNIGEWVEDCWNDNYNGAPADGSSWLAGNCDLRVVRGGNFAKEAWDIRAASRAWSFPSLSDYAAAGYSFRVARTLH